MPHGPFVSGPTFTSPAGAVAPANELPKLKPNPPDPTNSGATGSEGLRTTTGGPASVVVVVVVVEGVVSVSGPPQPAAPGTERQTINESEGKRRIPAEYQKSTGRGARRRNFPPHAADLAS